MIRNAWAQNADISINNPSNTLDNSNMSLDSSINLNSQSGPVRMPQAQNLSSPPMQAKLGTGQEHLKTVPQVQLPGQRPDDTTSGLNNSNIDAPVQTGPPLPAFNPSYENIYPPLAQSHHSQNTKNVRFTAAPGHERSQGPTRQSYAQAAGNINPDANQILERLKELHHTLLVIDQQLSGNLTMPEFNLVNHRFFYALDTYKCIQMLIKDSQEMKQEIYKYLPNMY